MKKYPSLVSWFLCLTFLGQSFLIPCSLSDTHMLLFNANFSVCKLITDLKIVNIFSLVVSAVVLFTWVFNKSVYDISALKEGEKMNELCFLFVLFCFKCYYFCL